VKIDKNGNWTGTYWTDFFEITKFSVKNNATLVVSSQRSMYGMQPVMTWIDSQVWQNIIWNDCEMKDYDAVNSKGLKFTGQKGEFQY